MNHLRVMLVITAAAGCSTPNPQPVAGNIAIYSQPYARQEPGPDLKAPRFCHVSLDCMELDSRPFTPCLAKGEPCEGEGGFMKATPTVIFESIQSEDIGRFPDLPRKK